MVAPASETLLREHRGQRAGEGSRRWTRDRVGRTTDAPPLYPSGEEAIYAYDFADRPSTLGLDDGVSTTYDVVTASSYLASGPLTSLTLENGVEETRAFDARYFPEGINAEAVSPLLEWAYTVDAIGNPLAIDDREFTYQAFQYHLTSADGPWGAYTWEYDRIGNRLEEALSGGYTDTYDYVANGASGNTPLLEDIMSGNRVYTYGPAGHLLEIARGANVITFEYDDLGLLSSVSRPNASP